MTATLVRTNAGSIATQLERRGAVAGARAYSVTQHYGILMQTRAKANASGRPGPRAQTGDYRRSIYLIVGVVPAGARADVGSNKPQARRLEYGFWNMTDSLGRTYHQPPLPHLVPAFRQTAPEYQASILAIGATP